MNISSFFPQTIAAKLLSYLIAVALLFGTGLYTGYHFEHKYLTNKYEAQIAALNTAAAQKEAAIIAARDAAEKEQAQTAAKAEADYENQINILNSTVTKLRAIHVVLHDPGSKSHNTQGTQSSTPTQSSDTGPGTSLSPAASDFLLGFAQRADTIRLGLIECQADDESIRKAIDQYNESLKKIDGK